MAKGDPCEEVRVASVQAWNGFAWMQNSTTGKKANSFSQVF
jgi:hypothetical protein